jgi:hypothetical protein
LLVEAGGKMKEGMGPIRREKSTSFAEASTVKGEGGR